MTESRSRASRNACKTCAEPFSEDRFYRAGKHWMSECKECWKKRVKMRRLLDPSVRAYDRERAKLPHRKALAMERQRITRKQKSDAYKAHSAVSYAVKTGRLEKEPCSVCGSQENLHAHHRDYSKPLEVIWLCARCHHRLHALFPEIEGVHKAPF